MTLLEMVLVSVARSTAVSAELRASAIVASMLGGIACIYACSHCLPQEPGRLVEDELRACTMNTAIASEPAEKRT